MARVEICEKCRRKWIVSKNRDASRMYLCPECEEKITGRKSVNVVWLDEKAARLRN
jgi:ribosomal protein L37AE/L43A